MEYYDPIEHCGVTIDLPVCDIGISASGGADSSLLLYLLMKHYKDTGHKIHVYTSMPMWKCMAGGEFVERVIQKCIELTGNTNVRHHVNFDHIGMDNVLPEGYVLQGWIEDEHEGVIDALYNATTANPPKDIADKFINEAENFQQSNRDPEIEHKVICKHPPTLLRIRPFINVNKKVVAEIYNELGIIDTLFPVTRSCESYDEKHYKIHCGECWWCKEREWGFGRLT